MPAATGIGAWIVGVAYLAMLAAIASERVERTKAALATLGVVLASSILLGFADPLKAATYVDLDVIGLVVVASIASWFIEDSGLAKRITVALARHSEGSPVRFIVLASMISGFLSLFLENVTVVILLAPIVFRVSRLMGFDAKKALIAVALSSNLSGSALLVGDPQAAIVASAFNLDFLDFIYYAGRPSMFFVVVAGMTAAILLLPYYAGLEKQAKTSRHAFELHMYVYSGAESPSHLYSLRFRDPRLATSKYRRYVKQGELETGRITVYEAAVVIAIAAKITLLALKNDLGLKLTEAAAPPILMLIPLFARSKAKLADLVKKSIDYKLLVFLASLFYLVGFIDLVSLTRRIADALLYVTGSILQVTVALILVSAIASSIMDNVPFIAAMIPVIRVLSETHGADPVVVSWSMLLGATLGGNLTYVGAMANYTAVRLLERHGYRVTFKEFMRIGVPFTVIALLAGSLVYYASYLDMLRG